MKAWVQSPHMLVGLGIASLLWLGGVGLGPEQGQIEAAIAQGNVPTEEISAEQVALFARVVLEMEPFRQEGLERSSEADQAEQANIRREFIRQATEVIEANGMTVPDYNRIIIQLRQDEGLRSQIEDEMLLLVQQSES